MAGSMLHTKFGQVTPPEDNYKTEWPSDTSADMPFPPPPVQASSLSEPSLPPHRTNSGSSNSDADVLGLQGSENRVDKKDKYREKNRVAAAKCRAKKKEHVDGLEENHRTQSMLNQLLKQTEQNLRDELSFWRTQALQHAFCDCHAVQEYNMKKARALAADKEFGGPDALRRDSMSAMSPSSKNGGRVPYYPSAEDFDPQQAS